MLLQGLTIILNVVFTTTIDFDFNTISSRIRELAFLNPEVCNPSPR